MATLKTTQFKHTNEAGETMEFKAAINVDAEGQFTVNIPDELGKSANVVLRLPIWQTTSISVTRPRVHLRVQGSNLNEVERFILEVMREHTTVAVREELVIRYRYLNHTTGAVGHDGKAHPNAGWVDKDKEWTWAGNDSIHAMNKPAMFSIGVVARVFKKVTYTRPNSERVEYTNDLPGSHFDLNPMRRLNGFVVHSPDYGCMHSNPLIQSGHSQSERTFELPYSDASADFFSDLMLTMFRLGEQLDNFIGNQDNLKLAIERGAGIPALASSGVNSPAGGAAAAE